MTGDMRAHRPSAEYRQEQLRPAWVEDGMDQERATIHSNVMDWLDNPRRKRMKRLKRFKNVRQSANAFKGILERFSPDDLKVDPL